MCIRDRADVVNVNVFDEHKIQEIEQMKLQDGETIKVSMAPIKAHNEQTKPWTTSRAPCFIQLQRNSTVQRFTDASVTDKWLQYHPVTCLKSMKYVPNGALVCVAGRIVDPAPVKKQVTAQGQPAEVTNINLLFNGTVVQLAAWHKQAEEAAALQVGELYLFLAVRCNKGNAGSIDLRYSPITSVGPCPDQLRESLTDIPTTAENADVLTKLTGKGYRDPAREPSMGTSVSMLAVMVKPTMKQADPSPVLLSLIHI